MTDTPLHPNAESHADPPEMNAEVALRGRASRPPDHQTEHAVITRLLGQMAARPEHALRAMIDATLELCQGHSAGLSTLREDQTSLHWSAVAGEWAHASGRAVARDQSPSGIVLRQNAPLLVSEPGEHFAPGADLGPAARELLMAPFHLGSAPAGTLWVVHHGPNRRFDSEDLRRLTALAPVAALALRLSSGASRSEWSVAEREQAEAALRESERRIGESQADAERQHRLYESILTNTPDFAYVWDLNHRFIYVNEGLLRMWGKTREEAIGRTCLELGYEPWHAEMHDREVDQIAATGQPLRGQVPFSGTFGRRIYDYILVPVFNQRGEVEAVAGTTRDVTELSEMEERLRNHSQQIETLLNAAPMGVFLVDAEFRIVSLNAIAQQAMGDQPDLMGQDFIEILRLNWSPTYATEVIQAYRDVLATGDSYIAPERGEFRADRGIIEYYEWRIDRLVLPDGRFGIVCYFRDISPQVEARKTVEQSRQALREIDRRKDEFLAVLAHELRNPLAPIRHGVRLLQHNPDEPAAVTAAASMMERQVAQLVRLVDDLLDVSRITTGRIDLRLGYIELENIIDQAVETIRPICEDMAHRIEVALPDAPIWIHGDRARLMQAFANLLSNACRYMDKGGQIWITAKQMPGAKGDEIEVSFRDTGIGIAPEQLHTIFDMYTQLDTSLERTQGGLGIGLTLAQSLLGLHGGRIEARSDGLGHGSEFVVHLPVTQTPLTELPTERTAPLAAANGDARRILVVDDNRDSADSLAQLLGLLGYEAEVAYDGEKAVELAATYRPQAVLLDLGMPRLNGYDACRRIRAEAWGRTILLIAQSGWAQDADKRRSQDAGFDFHLVKPVDHEELLRLLSNATPRVAQGDG